MVRPAGPPPGHTPHTRIPSFFARLGGAPMTGPGSWPNEFSHARSLMWAAAFMFVTAEGAIRMLDLYRRAPWVDVPSHFLSGAAVTAAIFLYLTHHRSPRRVWRSSVGNVAVALAWEAAEIFDEVITPDPPHLQDVFLWDGFWDVVSALAGGSVLLWALRHKQPPCLRESPRPTGRTGVGAELSERRHGHE